MIRRSDFGVELQESSFSFSFLFISCTRNYFFCTELLLACLSLNELHDFYNRNDADTKTDSNQILG